MGYSRIVGADRKEEAASFRLSRIANVRPSHARSGKVTAEQKRVITKKLQSEGVQFLLQESETIRLKLTKRGKQMYESMAHLRPAFSGREECADGSWIYWFHCTQLQAEYYFFKFGEEARILEPGEHAARFRQRFQAALDQY